MSISTLKTVIKVDGIGKGRKIADVVWRRKAVCNFQFNSEKDPILPQCPDFWQSLSRKENPKKVVPFLLKAEKWFPYITNLEC